MRQLERIACLFALLALAACGGRPAVHHTKAVYNPSRYYPPPGPASDPWGPYIKEASARFGLPEQWVRSVMRQESGGQQDVISWAGAMGLMQVMPDTYDELRGRYNLGDDPFDPHNNILAGTAYLKEMYDRYGSPGFLAAYNAGPNRVDRYLNNGTPLPAETVNYVAAIAPRLGSGSAFTGPLSVYASGGRKPTPGGCDPDAAYDPSRPCVESPRPAVAYSAPTPAGCDPDAAYDPGRPCVPLRVASPPTAVALATPAPADCDPDVAYDPYRPCRRRQAQGVAAAPLPPVALAAAVPPAASVAALPASYAPRRPMQEMMAQPVSLTAAHPAGRWGIQVGAFASLSTAQAAAERARQALPDLLRMANVELPATAPLGTQVAFRARLTGLPVTVAIDACAKLGAHGISCMTVPPG